MDIHMAANAAPRMFVGMKLSTLEEVARALDQARVRFILVGGIAVVAHGYGRLTRDLDLVTSSKPTCCAEPSPPWSPSAIVRAYP
jgi:predicted nucleotidyltransferase